MAEAADVATVRDEVRTWLAETWDPERPVVEWRGLLADAGWAQPTWPRRWYGRDLSGAAAAVVAEEMAAVGAVGTATGVGMSLVAPTLLAHASDELKDLLLRPILTGENTWCQLFSEPGSGSDLAGLTTRATRDGDEWVVDGQKVWNSGAHKAAYGILLARTDWDAPKHRGISYLVLPMHQDGVEVRPLRQMNGYATFNEVFLSGARTPYDHVVGAQGEGWRVALTTLAHERNVATGRRPRLDRQGGRTVREAQAEAAEYFKTYQWYPQRAGRADLVPVRATETGTVTDPLVRQQVAGVASLTRMAKWSGQRAVAARAQGRQPGPEGSLAKLNGSRIARACATAHSAIGGASGMLSGDDGPVDGLIAEVLISVPAMSIAGGTDEIQHNILGERVLGLPKEPGTDNDQPFRSLRTN